MGMMLSSIQLLLASLLILFNTPSSEVIKNVGKEVVVMELYTSEGCSSCPPADEVLSRLGKREDVIALSFHVDYWNYLGWRDPYSSGKFSERQRNHAAQLGARVYTPQVFLNGVYETVGSRAAEISDKIASMKERLHADVKVFNMDKNGNRLSFDYMVDSVTEDCMVNFAITENGLSNSITRGENKSRTLNHDHVVRVFEQSNQTSGRKELSIPAGVNMANSFLVVYVQDGQNMGVLGASKVAFP